MIIYGYILIAEREVFIVKKLFLNNKIIRNLELNNYEVAVYVALRSLYDSQLDSQVVTFNTIAYMLYGNKNYTKYTVNHIKNAFISLESLGLIKKIDAFSTTEFIVDMSNLYFEQNTGKGVFYTVITHEEVHRVMNIDTKKDNFAILRYFIILISSICHDKGTYDHFVGCEEHTDFVGFMPLDTLADWCGTTKARIIEYNSILETEKIIYIYRHKQHKKNQETGKIMSFSNHYGRYEDKQWIVQFANEYVSTFKLKETETLVKAEKSKINKRYAAIYNLLSWDFDKYIGNYSDAELIGTYKYIHGKNICNEKKLNIIEEDSSAYEDILGKIKNEDLFDNIPCVVDYVNRKVEKKRNMEKRKRNLIKAISDNNWGEPTSMERDFSIEEMLDMPTVDEVQMNLTNSDCVEYNEVYKENSAPFGAQFKTGDYKEPDYIEADNESHDNNKHELFCVTKKDLVDIDELY